MQNGVELLRLTGPDVLALEPNITSVGGILSPSTGIISAHGLMDYFYNKARTNGAEVLTRCEVVGLEKRSSDFLITVREGSENEERGNQPLPPGEARSANSSQLSTLSSSLSAPSSSLSALTSTFVVNAAVLESDTVAHLAGIDVEQAGYRLHWAKGSYFGVHGEKRQIVSRLIYPMPPRESLGVHAVIDLGGGLRFGPDV